MSFKAFSLLALITLTAAGVTGAPGPTRLVLPAGLPDGHYEGDGTIDPKTGFSQFIYKGPIDLAAVANFTASTSNEDETGGAGVLTRRATVNCNGRSAGDSVSSVQSAFASYWNNKNFSGKWAKTTLGSSQAFACNYGGTQTIHSSDFNSNMGSVSSVCGSSNAGWYEHANWKLNYGRDHINSPIC